MDGFEAPPQGDFQSYEKLVGQQGGHLGALNKWSSNQCGDTDGLDGLLYLLRGAVTGTSHFFAGKLAQSERGMGVVAGKVQQTSANYTGTDQNTAANLRSLYPTPLPGFPDIGAVPGMPRLGNFTDEPVTLTEPTGADADTAKNIKHQLMTMRSGFSSGPLSTAQSVFSFFTGQNLVELLLDPLVGDYGRLLYLHDAYQELGAGSYTVAATLRKGSWSLADEWTGQAAVGFDSYLFLWTMGIGGIGDAARVAAKVYKDGYDTVVALVYVALTKINQLLGDELEQLAEQGGELVEGDAAIEAVGGGPEDPLADIGAGIFSAYKLYKVYKLISRIVSIIDDIETVFTKISESVQAVESGITAIEKMIDSPMPTLGSLVNDVEQRGFSFEQNGAWDPTLGAVRIAMLPSA